MENQYVVAWKFTTKQSFEALAYWITQLIACRNVDWRWESPETCYRQLVVPKEHYRLTVDRIIKALAGRNIQNPLWFQGLTTAVSVKPPREYPNPVNLVIINSDGFADDGDFMDVTAIVRDLCEHKIEHQVLDGQIWLDESNARQLPELFPEYEVVWLVCNRFDD